MKPSKRTLEIEARRAADPIAQELGRTDIDYGSDDLPTAPRFADGQKPVATIDFVDAPFHARCLYCSNSAEPGAAHRIAGLENAIELRAVNQSDGREVPICLKCILLLIDKFHGKLKETT